MKGKILGIILVSALSLGVTSCCEKKNGTAIQEEEYQRIEYVSGKLKSIDEDSLAIAAYCKGANFELEHMRIECNGKTYNLIYPGPTNYKEGDEVNFRYKPMSKISYDELVRSYGTDYICSLQKGSFNNIDGIITGEMPNKN